MHDMLGGKDYLIELCDSIEHMATLPKWSFDFALYSPPYPSVFSYGSSPADIGNSEDLKAEAKIHLSFFFRQFARLLKPGRAAIVHCTQIPRKKRDNEYGLFDFRGMLIALGQRAGLIYEYDWLIDVNPQAQAIRTRSRELQFQGLEKDRACCRGALGDYLIKFRAPGVNAVHVDSKGDVTREDWIKWAACSWHDINRTRTLNTYEGKSEEDTKHICALQLDVIDRVVRLFTNPGEIVFSPFAGIGSEGDGALRAFRRFYGCELKQEYHAAALVNMERAIKLRTKETELPLFDGMLV